MLKIYFEGEGKPSDICYDVFADYDGSPAMVINRSKLSHDGMTQAIKRYFNGAVSVVSRKGILYLNRPVRTVKKAPSVLYYEGDWERMLSTELRRVQQVVNLTDDYKRNCDFVKQLNTALALYFPDLEYVAGAKSGSCLLATFDYWDEVNEDGEGRRTEE